MPEEALNEPCQLGVAQAWALELGLRLGFGKQGRIEIEHAPAADAAGHGNAVVHLAGIDGDDAARERFHRPDAAPGPLGTGKHNADAILIVAVAREGPARLEFYRVDARNLGPVLLHVM